MSDELQPHDIEFTCRVRVPGAVDVGLVGASLQTAASSLALLHRMAVDGTHEAIANHLASLGMEGAAGIVRGMR